MSKYSGETRAIADFLSNFFYFPQWLWCIHNQPQYKVIGELGYKTLYASWSQFSSRAMRMHIYKGKEIHKDVNKVKYIIWELLRTLTVTLSKLIYFRDEKPEVRNEKILPRACGLGVYLFIHRVTPVSRACFWSSQTQLENQGWIRAYCPDL